MEVTSPSFYNMEERRSGTSGAGGGACPEKEDYIQITLTDEEDIIDGFMKLRIIFPNLMRLTYDNSRTRTDQALEAAGEVEQKSELELLEEFYELQNNQPMNEEQIEFAKMYLTNVVTGKRYIKKLVEDGIVDGWDDPRLVSIAALRRRGVDG